MFLYIIWLTIGLAALFYGADRLVKGSSSIAIKTGISPLIIGLTIVAIATSSPELVVSIQAAFKGSPSIAVGNVVGSNIANIGLVLGLTALIYPVKVNRLATNRELWIMVFIVFLMYALMYNHKFTRLEGFLLLGIFAGYVIYQIKMAQGQLYQTDDPDIKEVIKAKSVKLPLAVAYIFLGGVLLIIGADRFLYGAVGIGQAIGISEAVIGLTVVSVGTSLPELATTVVAAFRRQSDMALGNVIGSNIFNVLSVLGITASIHPLTGGDITWTDLNVMLAFSVVLIPVVWFLGKVNRITGAVLFLGYILYMIYLF
jgi:cation:H+ antiporter